MRRTIPPKTKMRRTKWPKPKQQNQVLTQSAEAEALAKLGREYDELRMAYMYGKIGYYESWATFCRKELGRTKVDVDRIIQIARAEDPLAKLREQRREDHRRLAEGVERKEERRREWLKELLESSS
jgi:hypothetical protein